MADRFACSIRMSQMSYAIKLLTDILSGRTFDFTYKLANEGCPITVENQKLLSESLQPIHVEKRVMKKHQKEYLVFVVEAVDDLLVSVSDWIGPLDIVIKEDRKIIITNYDDDRYEFIIHPKK